MSVSTKISSSFATPESPWLGLRSFSEDAQSFFFGRSAELDDLYERILDKPLAVLFGQSGLGKSSLLQAALAPRLRATGFLPVLIRFDHDASAPPLEYQLLESLRVALVSAGNEQHAATLFAALAEGKTPLDCAAFLWLLFHDPAYGFIPTRAAPSAEFPRPVFLIDQFEEIFTLGERPARRSASAAFRESLAALVENRPPAALRAMLEDDDDLAERLDYRAQHTRVLVSLREDFLHLLERWRRLMPSLMENRFELRMLSGPQAFLAVVRPGQLRSGMPAIIPNEVGEAIVRFVAGTSDDLPLEEIDAVPPLLSLVCAELNAQRLASGEVQITQAQFEGHSTDILASFYLRSFEVATYGSVLEGIPHAETALKNLRCLIEDRLLSADGFRESIAFDTIARDLAVTTAPNAAKAVLDELVQRRLLTVEERGGVRRIELAHDVLTRIVKASRDERHEVEAVSRAKLEKERAEAETARILKERNRLQRLAILASCLAVIALVGAGVGWIGFRQSQQAKNQAIHAKNDAVNSEKQAILAKNQAIKSEKEAVIAKNRAVESEKLAVAAKTQAQNGFESAWKGLSSLYDDYAASTLENTQGISTKQANALKSKLRGHLLEQLRKLNEQQPDHRGTIHDIARLLLDEGREAIADKYYARAQEKLTEALQWSEKRKLDTAHDTETYADILLEQARVTFFAVDQVKGAEIAARHLDKIRNIASHWPDSWRLEYVMIRLENLQGVGTAEKRESYARLAARMPSLIEKSNWHFDPVLWAFVINRNQYGIPKEFRRNPEDYASVLKLIKWFRTHVVDANHYTIAQMEFAAVHFQDLLSIIQRQFEQPNDNSTTQDRRDILSEFEATLSAIEARLPKSRIVYGLRGDLLRLQEMSIKDGINTRSPDELRAAAAKHRMVAAALGVGSSVADTLVPAFKSYTAVPPDKVIKESALAAIRDSLPDYFSLDIIGADTVIQNYEIRSSLEKLQSKDPVAQIHEQMVDQYLQLYSRSTLDTRAALIATAVRLSSARTTNWYTAKDYAKINEFWDLHYAGLPIKALTSGEQSDLVVQLKMMASSLFLNGRQADATQLWNDVFALCDAIIADRPWDFYVRQNMFGLCFEAAKLLDEKKETVAAQQWLRRGWEKYKEFAGNDIDLDKYASLPLKGAVPDEISGNDAAFFAALKPKDQEETSTMKSFTIPCDIGGVKFPFYVFIVAGRNGHQRLLDQFRWLAEYRGGTISKEVLDVFERLHNQADSANVDYCEYYIREFPKAALQEADRQLRAARNIVSSQDKQQATPNEIARAQQELAAAYANACRSAMEYSNWEGLGQYANDWLAGDANNAGARSSLAIALFAQGRIVEALPIYHESWNKPEFKKAAAADFAFMRPSDGRASSLRRLYLIATENNVSFPDLIEYALKDELEKARSAIAEERAKEAGKQVKEGEDAYRNDKSDTNRQKLVTTYNAASNRAFYVKRWTDAENWARKSIELTQSNPVAHGNLATALLFQDKYEQALKIYEAHLQDPLNDKTLRDSVLADLHALEKANVKHPDVTRIKAVLVAQRLLNVAIDGIMKCEALYAAEKNDANRDELAAAYNRAAHRAFYRERWSDAENWARKSIELDGSGPLAHGYLATSLLFQGKYDQALEIYRAHWRDVTNDTILGETVIADFETLEEAGIKHADVARIKAALVPQQRLDEAIEELKKCEAQYSVEMSDTNRGELAAAYNTAAHRALFRERWSDAENWARKSIEFDGSGPLAHGNLATSLLFQGKYDQALEIYRAHWRDETNFTILSELVIADFETLEEAGIKHSDVARIRAALVSQQRLDEAIEELKKCEAQYSAEMSDTNRSELAVAYNTAAYRALFRERWDDAESWARKSIEFDASDPFAYGNLGTALLFQGKYDQALKIYRAHWRDEKNGSPLGKLVIADFEDLKKAGITHPDVVRLKAELEAKQPDAPAADEKKPEADKKP